MFWPSAGLKADRNEWNKLAIFTNKLTFKFMRIHLFVANCTRILVTAFFLTKIRRLTKRF
jgi:hypothetical protein